MPDLKLNQETILKAINDARDDAIRRVEDEADRMKRDVATVAEMLPHVPDAVGKAEMAAVVDFRLLQGSYSQNGCDLRLDLNGCHAHAYLSTPLESGARYRAFIFISKVP